MTARPSFDPCELCGTWLTTDVQGATLPLECEPPVIHADGGSTIAITLQAHFPERCRAAREREVAW